MILLLYACTIFLSACLLFQIEPLIGKTILPWFGGSAAVWSTCLFFFQVMLVMGYLYAHLSTRWLSRRQQGMVHIALIAASLLLLPITPDPRWANGSGDPVLPIVALLSGSIGLPFFILSSTGPLLQAWSNGEHLLSRPYRLFALSNVGSALGLLSYPLIIEPAFGLHWQARGWSVLYVVFGMACCVTAWPWPWRPRRPAIAANTPFSVAACTLADARMPAVAGASATLPIARPTFPKISVWLALAAVPAVLMMAITTYLTRNVAPIPLLWVVPLALYLLSFILCFEGRNWYRRTLYPLLFVLAFVGMTAGVLGVFSGSMLLLPVLVFNAGLFIACMLCHGELARQKPDARYLTVFYLALSIGGALGGTFTALIAPIVFSGDFELPIALAVMAFIATAVLREQLHSTVQRPARRHKGLMAAGFGTYVAIIALTVSGLAFGTAQTFMQARLSVRNFYGTLTVRDTPGSASKTGGDGGDALAQRHLLHGNIIHGAAFLAPGRRDTPTTYYGKHSGVSMAILATRTAAAAQSVGVVGLGAGTLASYGRPGDRYQFFEIDPLMADIARTQFWFLRDSPAQTVVTLGDGRRQLASVPDHSFDVLVVDAFSGDAIPVHLLTKEAFALYFEKMKPDGLLAIHVTNRYLDLLPVVQRAADEFHRTIRMIVPPDDVDLSSDGELRSVWVVIAAGTGIFQRPEFAHSAVPIDSTRHLPIWTDDYSSLYRVLK